MPRKTPKAEEIVGKLRQVERKIANLVDAISEGVRSADRKSRRAELEVRLASLEAELANPTPALPAMHPNLAQLYRRKIAQLREALAGPNASEAREAARELIDKVIITPPRDDGDPPRIELVGELSAILKAAGLGAQSSAETSPIANNHAKDILSLFATSAKGEQGARLPGGGSRGQSPPLFLL